jgi:hypothetical protein
MAGYSARIVRIASAAGSPGIFKSISTTSGRNLRTSPSASPPSPASPTICSVSFWPSTARNPSRTMA